MNTIASPHDSEVKALRAIRQLRDAIARNATREIVQAIDSIEDDGLFSWELCKPETFDEWNALIDEIK